MISVHYKPFDALRPVHIALLASLESPTTAEEVAANLSVPNMILDHAVDDVVSWALATRSDGKIVLLNRGARCVAVWAETGKRGYWEYDNIEGWFLGKGVFFFRKPLDSISEAGLDVETGIQLIEKKAIAQLREYRKAFEYVESEINEKALQLQVLKSHDSAEELVPVIETALSRATNRLHVNQLCRLAENALYEIEQNKTCNKGQIVKARKFLRDKPGIERKIRNQDQSLQVVVQVVLASWLSRRTGLLREIADSEPAALLIKSDCGDISWLADPKWSGEESEAPELNHHESETPVAILKRGLSWLREKIGDIW